MQDALCCSRPLCNDHCIFTLSFVFKRAFSKVSAPTFSKLTVLYWFITEVWKKTWKFKLGETVVLFSTCENGRAVYRDNTCYTFFID